MLKRIYLIIGIIALLLVLAACGGREDPVVMLVANNPVDRLVYESDEGSNIVFKGDNGLSYWSLTKAGTGALTTYEGSLPPMETENEDGVRTYLTSINGEDVRFQVYVMPEIVTGDPDDIVMIALRFSLENILYPRGKDFNPVGIETFVVYRDGTIEELHNTLTPADYAAHFDTHGYDPLSEEGFKDGVQFPVTLRYEGFEQSFVVYQAGGEKPIHPGDATFFDWALVIPVAFLTQFFAGLMGSNFALGILFTTIIVRTLAWPIYAKSNDMSLKMNLAQPDMQRVQQKFATRKDPQSQQMMQMEMMQVYKKHGINVFGCLIPFLQMPIFIAMYAVVRRITLEGGLYTANVTNTQFLGVNLANQNDGIIGMLLAAIVGGTMFLLQSIAMKKPNYVKKTTQHNKTPQAMQTEKTMKMVSYFMVIMMMFISFQSNALAIYWIFGNIYSLGQTMFNRKMNEKKHMRLQQKQITG
ncbi:MAG: membrane protein insertase YidC [Acholeplasmataceae bacterium]|nr:MAG: membrane protein insertase YidC [Acholeplasmataceae bacterium]